MLLSMLADTNLEDDYTFLNSSSYPGSTIRYWLHHLLDDLEQVNLMTLCINLLCYNNGIIYQFHVIIAAIVQIEQLREFINKMTKQMS